MSKKNRNRSKQVTKVNQNNDERIKSIQSLQASYSGPLPPPKLFEEYNNVLPGAAERILAMAEKQANHRQQLEKKVIESGSRDSLIGLIFGFVLGLVTVLGGIFCILKGQSTGGTILSGAGLVSLVSVFVYGSRQRRIERQSKRDEQ